MARRRRRKAESTYDRQGPLLSPPSIERLLKRKEPVEGTGKLLSCLGGSDRGLGHLFCLITPCQHLLISAQTRLRVAGWLKLQW